MIDRQNEFIISIFSIINPPFLQPLTHTHSNVSDYLIFVQREFMEMIKNKNQYSDEKGGCINGLETFRGWKMIETGENVIVIGIENQPKMMWDGEYLWGEIKKYAWGEFTVLVSWLNEAVVVC